ncbi:MAG: TCP-1/cpn60 chaperonin family protein [Peptococcaceae bacterium]|nr:TCP-1/cpn60 chaperonin family protein [Peptococcaceae bacterium]
MSTKAANSSEPEERFSALITNANAVRAITAAVEGTIGPKGLDTMLVDKFGDVVITNDGVTILNLMEVNHPAAKMIINMAKSQQNEIGDGTTTATILAGGLVAAGVEQVVKGVPVARVIEGLRIGMRQALQTLAANSRPVEDLDSEVLHQVAMVAGRENGDIAHLVVAAAKLVGLEKLRQNGFLLADTIMAEEGAENEVFQGVIINKAPMTRHMPKDLSDLRVLVVDDALEPEEVEDEALGTDAGFARYLKLQEEFKQNLSKVRDLGIKLVLVDRGVSDAAEELLTDWGVMVLQRVPNKELLQVAEHTGARPIKRTGLKKSEDDLAKVTGRAARAYLDEKLEHVRILQGAGKPTATVLVGAATAEIVGERERIAKDAASSVQAAVLQGIVPGGGAVELAVAREVEKTRQDTRGMPAYGVKCVEEALQRPFSQIVLNAGFNPLEKLGDVIAAQVETGKDSLSIDCDSGEVVDMLEKGVVDPAMVKIHALRAAGEVAEAILRIDTIIRKRDEDAREHEF